MLTQLTIPVVTSTSGERGEIAINTETWLKILALILELLAKGTPKHTAISKAAATFGVSADEVRRRL
jgi:hypothetical protein